MKRIISLLMAVVIMVSITSTSFAADTGEEYYTVQVEYSDNIGHQEELDVMIQNNNVFVDAKMLAERLGYTFGENGECAIFYNKDTSNGLPFGITQFKYNSTQVSHMVFNKMIDTYEAPFASVKNSKGSWIPLEYSLLLINSGIMITDDALLIDIPTKRIIDYFYDIAKNSEKYNFDWADDFGYTETDIKLLGGSSHLINVFNGLLGFDGASWATLFQQFAGSMASYDKKYGENLAMLLCTESDKELQATIDKVDMLVEVLDEDGKLGQMLSSASAMLDSQVGTLYENCEDILQKVKNGNSPLVSYNRSYQALEDALDRQTWFSNTGGNILEVQKGVSSAAGKAFTFLDVGTKVLEVVGYTQEFQNQDKFSLAALTYYLDNEDGGLELPEAMKKSMVDYSDALSSSIGEYTTKRFAENVDQWIIDEIPMHEVLGTQAAAVLFAWDIASNTIPFIANGLSGADSFELALYSLVFQEDAFLNYLSKRNSVFADSGKITAENVYDIAQYCYIYLKSCYTTREAALASLANKSSSTKEKIQPLIDYQNSINAEIAKILVELKGANKTNDGGVFGFLPSDNEDYLGKYDDSQLISWIMTNDLASDADLSLPLEETSAPETTEPSTLQPEATESGGLVSVEVIRGDTQRVGVYDVTVDTLLVEISGNKNAAEKIMRVFEEWKEKALNMWADSGGYSGSESGDALGFDQIELTVTRTDSTTISVLLFETTYHGGNLCIHSIRGYTFSTQSGDVLALSDLSADGSALKQALRDACWNQLVNASEYSHLTSRKEGFDCIFSEETYEWTLDSDGIHVYLPEYSLGSHADGIISFVVPYHDLTAYLYNWVIPK